MRHLLHIELYQIYVVLDEMNIRLRWIGYEADDTIGKATTNAKYSRIRNVGSNGDTKCSGFLLLTLSQPFFVVGLRILR